MAPVEPPALLRVEVVYSPAPGQVIRTSLSLAEPVTAGQAVQRSGLPQQHPELQSAEPLCLGIWGKTCDVDAVLRDRDRVEVYRPLQIDPKDARRLRQRRASQAAGPKR